MTKHRRLFLNPGNPNAAVPCPDICVPTCPPGCGPYETGYSEQPPPPQLPALRNSSSGSSKQGEHISPLAIGIVIFLAACFIVITLYLLTSRCRRRRWYFLRRRRGELRQGPTTIEQFQDENHGPAGIDYPIWCINTIGLRPAVIDSITIFRYSKDDRLIEGTECAVCLTEFQDDDVLRLLPKCNHAFHVPCIDTWLRSHVNCPVCRAGIVSGVSASIPVTSNALNLINLGANEDSQVLNTNPIGEDEIIENRPETGEVDQMVEVQERKMEDGNGEEQSEPVRRSVSVDSSLPLHLPTRHVNDT